MTEFFMAIGDDEAADEARRGRTAERRVSTIAERRGRSVVRKGVSDGGKAASEGGSARRRSVSVARYRQPNSESYSSAVTDDEAPDSHSNNGNVKTIRAVYAQKKSDHPVREVDENGLLQAMRKEVQHAVEEIRTELEQVMVRSMPVPSGKDNLPSDGAEVVRAIGEIRRSYTEKLEQSEKRKRDLLAELAVEEQRGLEISKIVRELLPDSAQTTKCSKQSQFRKRSNDRTRMSRASFVECNSKQVRAELSSFDMEEYRKLHTDEALLFEIFKQRPRMELGGLLPCCRTYL